MSRPSDDLLQLGEPAAGSGMTPLQMGYFQPSGIAGPAAVTPPMMSPVGVIPPSVPFQGSSFSSAVPPTQPFAAAVPSTQQTFPSAMPQAGSYPAAASVGSYPAAASSRAVPLHVASATTSAATSQNSVSWYNCLTNFYYGPALNDS